jgi:amidase
MTVKESFDVAGLPTTWGFAEHADHIAQGDALAVERLKSAGAIIVGKTNVPVALADLQSNNPVYGRTRNAHHPERSAGGSSGGSAVALASGMVPLEFGSDIGGSIRVPAAFNGVWGHKPTFDALSKEGHFFPRTDAARGALSVIGPMARDPDDLAVALDLVSDVALPHGHARRPEDWRVLLLTSHPAASVQNSITAALDALGAALERAGARVDRATDLLPDLEAQHRNYMMMLNWTMLRGRAQGGHPAPSLGAMVRSGGRADALHPRMAAALHPLRRGDRTSLGLRCLSARRHRACRAAAGARTASTPPSARNSPFPASPPSPSCRRRPCRSAATPTGCRSGYR